MARNFAGSTNHSEIAFVPVAAAPMTIACLFRMTNHLDGLGHMLFGSFEATTNFGFRTDLTVSAVLRAVTRDGGGTRSAVASVAVPDELWHSSIAEFASATSRTIWYDNGSSVNNAISATPGTLTRTFIGSRKDTTTASENSGHDMARCCVWNTTLSADERAMFHARVSPFQIKRANLKFYTEGVRNLVDAYGGAFTVTGTTVVDHPRIFEVGSMLHATPAAVAVTFNASWNIAANTLIQPGAMTA